MILTKNCGKKKELHGKKKTAGERQKLPKKNWGATD